MPKRNTAECAEDPKLRADARRNRDRILATAIRHFSQRGVETSLEEVANDAGVGVGTLYRHFPSREALLAGALQDRQAELLKTACEARAIADSEEALQTWLLALEDYLRTFDGLPAPVLEAVKERASPLALTCEELVSITDEFLDRAKEEKKVRASVCGKDLFLCTLGLAWVLNRECAGESAQRAMREILARGYVASAAAAPRPKRR